MSVVAHLKAPLGPHAVDRQVDAATGWLMDQDRLALVIEGPSVLAESVHLRALADNYPLVYGRMLSASARTLGRASLLVVRPSRTTLEAATLQDRDYLVLHSGPGDPYLPWQDAWCWAHHSHDLRGGAGPAVVCAGVSIEEEWAFRQRATAETVGRRTRRFRQ